MTKNNKICFFSLIKWITNKYVTLEKQTIPHAFKVLDVTDSSDQIIINVGFSGLTHSVDLPLDEIINKNLFEYFSSEDKKLLFSLQFKYEKYCLSDIYRCKKTNQSLAVLTELKTGNRITMSTLDVTRDANIVRKLSPISINTIAYIAGIDQQKENK